MKLTRYCTFILLITVPLGRASSTPSRKTLALSALTDATVALLAACATIHIIKTAKTDGEITQPIFLIGYNLSRRKGSFKQALSGEDENTWGIQIVRPFAYMSLLYTTGRLAVTRSISAYKLLNEAYTKHREEITSPVVEKQNVTT